MSKEQPKRGFGRELLGTLNSINHPEERLKRIFDEAKEVVEAHPKVALAAAIAGGILAYELYQHEEHEYEKTGKMPEGPIGGSIAAVRGMLDRVEKNPTSLVSEAYKGLEGISTYVKNHKALALGISVLGPIALEHFAKPHKTAQPVRRA